jgi:hypothetical protein
MRLIDLTENRPAHLFHGTPLWPLLGILKDNQIDSGVHWGNPNEPDGVRLTRDKKVATIFSNVDDGYMGGTLIFDQNILRQTYKIQPYDDFSSDTAVGMGVRRGESEEVILTKSINPLDRYLVGIICPDLHIRYGIEGIAEGFGSHHNYPDSIDNDEEAMRMLNVLANHPQRVNK